MSTLDERDDSFGFGSLRAVAKDRIRYIKPTGPKEDVADTTRIDAVAENAGFVSREAPDLMDTPVAFGRAKRPEPRSALNMRVPVSLGHAFQRFCEENRYSYPEGLEEIMKRASLPLR